jgi:hypothetical protein
MPRRQLVPGHAVTAPPVREGPDGIADSGRDRARSGRSSSAAKDWLRAALGIDIFAVHIATTCNGSQPFVFTIIPAISFNSFAATTAVKLVMSQRGLYSTMSAATIG